MAQCLSYEYLCCFDSAAVLIKADSAFRKLRHVGVFRLN